jgi:hypothetical protein
MLIIIKMKLYRNCLLTVLSIILMTVISIYIIINKESFIEDSDVDDGENVYKNSEAKKQGENNALKPSLDNKLKGCDPSDTLEDICYNHVTCCNGIKSSNHSCYCEHPISKSCIEGYNKCKDHLEKSTSYMKWVGKQEIENMCKDSLKLCCSKFSGIDTSSVKFEKKDPIKPVIKLNPFCALGAKKDVEQNCQKMCATYQPCKGFIADRLGCTLFDNIEYYVAPNIVNSRGRSVTSRSPDPNRSIDGYNPQALMLKID